ncbi:MAG TPA: class I SAM-dependent methyltransferase [Desulfuromonadales bacterium]|nr:class I SAM-dependent methyltransferase [Desulfuromonadales bacterium]
MKTPNLNRIIPRAHEFVREVLGEGDLAVDLTAGNGHDTLMLAEAVGPTGQVVAFDVQQAAVERTSERLNAAGIAFRRIEGIDRLEPKDRVGLFLADHARFAACLPRPPQAVLANLGYLPGSDRTVATRPATTRAALEAAFESLAVGGRVAVVVYVSHDGAALEADTVDALVRQLPADCWQVLEMRAVNRPEAPYLIVAQKDR